MRRRDRIILVVETLRSIEARLADYAIFEDADHPEHYVQLADFGQGKITYVEVTCRDWGAADIPTLTQAQVDALVALGFGRTPDPNHAGLFAWPDPVCLAKLCDAAFMILGSLPDFTLKVARTSFWSTPKMRALANAPDDQVREAQVWGQERGHPVHPHLCSDGRPAGSG